jgi:hypothetical protein
MAKCRSDKSEQWKTTPKPLRKILEDIIKRDRRKAT